MSQSNSILWGIPGKLIYFIVENWCALCCIFHMHCIMNDYASFRISLHVKCNFWIRPLPSNKPSRQISLMPNLRINQRFVQNLHPAVTSLCSKDVKRRAHCKSLSYHCPLPQIFTMFLQCTDFEFQWIIISKIIYITMVQNVPFLTCVYQKGSIVIILVYPSVWPCLAFLKKS